MTGCALCLGWGTIALTAAAGGTVLVVNKWLTGRWLGPSEFQRKGEADDSTK